jgi:hypothetical protein
LLALEKQAEKNTTAQILSTSCIATLLQILRFISLTLNNYNKGLIAGMAMQIVSILLRAEIKLISRKAKKLHFRRRRDYYKIPFAGFIGKIQTWYPNGTMI